MAAQTWKGLEVRSLLSAEGVLQLSLQPFELPPPGADEVIVRVEASPLNPSDMGLLFGPANLQEATVLGTPEAPVLTAPVAPQFLRPLTKRVGQALAVGTEGAGTVVAAGSGAEAARLVGRVVAVMAGGMYAQYRCVKARDCLVAPEGTTAAMAASSFVNPFTALGMLETMRTDGHTALVHTAAASNLGQMLNRLCIADNVPLVNIVRSAAQVALLRGQGAQYVCDSSAATFRDELVAALHATGATLMFDAIGGGRLVAQVLAAMEEVAAQGVSSYSMYGTSTRKEAYIYGGLDPTPSELRRGFGMEWRVGGWLVFNFMTRAGESTLQRLKDRVATNLPTIFASSYEREIVLEELLQPEVARAFAGRKTGGKFLVRPHHPQLASGAGK